MTYKIKIVVNQNNSYELFDLNKKIALVSVTYNPKKDNLFDIIKNGNL